MATQIVTITYDQDLCDHESVTVQVGQRELAAWERSRSYVKDRYMLMFRFAAWDALRRRRALPVDPSTGKALSQAAWDDLVISAEPEDDDDGDPTSGGQPNTD